jgi:hypothetical protein
VARTPSTFRQQDVTRALKGARAAGLPVAGFKIGAKGEIEVVIGNPEAHRGESNQQQLRRPSHLDGRRD